MEVYAGKTSPKKPVNKASGSLRVNILSGVLVKPVPCSVQVRLSSNLPQKQPETLRYSRTLELTLSWKTRRQSLRAS